MQCQLTDLDRIAIQSYRDSVSRRNKPVRKPIFDRSRVKTIGQLLSIRQAVESTRFITFGASVAAEMQKAGM